MADEPTPVPKTWVDLMPSLGDWAAKIGMPFVAIYLAIFYFAGPALDVMRDHLAKERQEITELRLQQAELVEQVKAFINEEHR